jgi:imidazolonepropionase-like amidohydrolase
MQNHCLRFICAAVALLSVLASPLSRAVEVAAQQSGVDTYAITGARIVTVSGPIIQRGTIVIRRGLIQSVGENVTAPADARVIDGTGLTVYPGLIDAYTSLGIQQPGAQAPRAGGAASTTASPTPQPSQFSSPNPTQPVGLQPEIQAVDFIKPELADIEAARNAGITAALSAPREGIFMGQSALINLSGANATSMVVRAPVAMHIGFTPLRSGVYPSSLLGVFSALRQMLLDAGRLREANRIYERSPRGLRRPEQDRSLVALFPALAREMPVVMFANTEREIRRALDLAEEFNLRLIIAGGAESWKVTDRLRAREVPVLLSLNFPRRMTAQSEEADPEPLRILRARVDAPKTAARLQQAGVRFAFQDGAMQNMTDFISNAVKAVEQGLSRDEAIRAMTLRPAEIFGVSDRMGSIEAGKIANLTVTRGDIFDRNARLMHVFIDGRPVDLRPVVPSAQGAQATGNWTLNVNLGEGDVAVTLNLEQQGERLSGSISGALGSEQIANASAGASGDIRFTVPVNIGGQTTEATFTGTITGNEMRGTVQVTGRSPGSFSGTRPGGPPATTRPAAPNPAQPQPSPQPSPSMTASRSDARQGGDKFSGAWGIEFIIGSDKVPAILWLIREGSRLSGTIEGPFPQVAISNGTVSERGFQFSCVVTLDGRQVEMTFTGNVTTAADRDPIVIGREVSTMRGTVTSSLGSIPFSGTRH